MRRGSGFGGRAGLGMAVGVALLALASAEGAASAPIATEVLVLRDATDPRGPRIRFDAALVPALAGDPRTDGATIELVGNAAGEGATGVVALHASRWRGLGSPPGSAGYEYRDPEARGGIRRAVLTDGPASTSLEVFGGSSSSFRVEQAHAAIDVRFAIGDEAWCARATAFGQNRPGRLVARDQPAPASCAARTARCGNRVVESGEACDGGAPAGEDGCSAACALEGAAGVCAGVARSPHDRVRFTRVASGLANATHVTAPPRDPRRLFVVLQTGQIRVVRDGSLLATPFLEIPRAELAVGGERGLLALAFHPDYHANRRFFVFYTAPDGDLVVARFERSADPDQAVLASRRIVVRRAHPRGNHNGGQLAFGPDGYLYAGFGDGGGSGDPDETAQSEATLLGKILRIDVNVDDRPYFRVPPTNPFAGGDGRLGLIWSLGFRNPWRFSFDRLSGDLYVADVGQGLREEIDFEPAGSPGGRNYGWDVFEGTLCHDPEPLYPSCAAAPAFVEPVFEYDHDAPPPAPEGCSVTGGFVYRGCRVEGMQGEYFFSDFCTRFVRSFRGVAGGRAVGVRDRTAELAPLGFTIGNVTSFGEDARGEIHLADQGGQVFRLDPID